MKRHLKYSGRSGFTEGGLILSTLVVFIAPLVSHVVAKPELVRKSVPVVTLLLIWIVSFGIITDRRKQELRRELRELNGLNTDKLEHV